MCDAGTERLWGSYLESNDLETYLANEVLCVGNLLWHHASCADGWEHVDA